jgi:pimeloyl-ACP methyl ester carboxylesterase
VIAGRDDPATPPEHGRRIADAVPGARLEVVPEAAHLGSYEQAETFTRLVMEHLQQPSGRKEPQ